MKFLTKEQVKYIKENFQLPVYVYSEKILKENADKFLAFPSIFWHNVRYAMKANSNINILKIFKNKGLKIDASSEYEAYRALNAGFKPEDIQISSQETPRNLEELLNKWVFIVATSLKQLESIWKTWFKWNIGVRINPWMGSGAFKSIATWWKTSSFGIWYEYIPQIKEISQKYGLNITKIHIHIWSENTPESWTKSASIWLDFVKEFENVDTLDLWWGFKMAIMPYEKTADLQAIWEAVKEKIEDFYKKTWRKIKLELEPGKYLVINSASVVALVDDIVDTGENWYKFIRTNTGMTEMPRVSMYGVQQPITVVNDSKEKDKYVVVGHCCESWDILTCKLYNPWEIEEWELNKANIWDSIVIDWVGAYNSSMSMKNYNSFPEAWELLLRENGEIVEIRKREKLEEIWRNEIEVI